MLIGLMLSSAWNFAYYGFVNKILKEKIKQFLHLARYLTFHTSWKPVY